MTRQSRDESWRTSGYLNRHWESTENWHRLAGRGGNCSRSIDASRREGVLYAVRPAPVVGETRTVIRRFHPLPPSTSSVPLFSPFSSRVFCDPLRSRTSSFTPSYLLLSDTTSSTSFSSVSPVSLSLPFSLFHCFCLLPFVFFSSLSFIFYLLWKEIGFVGTEEMTGSLWDCFGIVCIFKREVRYQWKNIW